MAEPERVKWMCENFEHVYAEMDPGAVSSLYIYIYICTHHNLCIIYKAYDMDTGTVLSIS